MSTAVNPFISTLHDCHARAVPAVITFRSEGEDCGCLAEVADVDGVMVTLFGFEAGVLFHLWLGAVTGVEVWKGAVTA